MFVVLLETFYTVTGVLPPNAVRLEFAKAEDKYSTYFGTKRKLISNDSTFVFINSDRKPESDAAVHADTK